MRNGICVAGNMIVDILYPIQRWPQQGELTTIKEGISRSSGGAACNVIMDLARLDETLSLTALGMLGADAEGEFVMERLGEYKNIDTSRIRREGISSFTAVMSDEMTKQRTFFHYRGTNAIFDESYINWDSIDSELLHIGYILLLDALDKEDDEYGTQMARLLHSAQQRGIKTSIDVVSEASDRFKRLVPPALRYTDYCIINEIEAQAATDVQLRSDNGTLIVKNMPVALNALFHMGVSTWAVIHCPEGGFGMDKEKNYFAIDSLKLPEGYIKGSVGAGDAFCAGVLYAVEQKHSLEKAIKLGIASAACSLSEAGASEGMRSAKQAIELYNKLR